MFLKNQDVLFLNKEKDVNMFRPQVKPRQHSHQHWFRFAVLSQIKLCGY